MVIALGMAFARAEVLVTQGPFHFLYHVHLPNVKTDDCLYLLFVTVIFLFMLQN